MKISCSDLSRNTEVISLTASGVFERSSQSDRQALSPHHKVQVHLSFAGRAIKVGRSGMTTHDSLVLVDGVKPLDINFTLIRQVIPNIFPSVDCYRHFSMSLTFLPLFFFVGQHQLRFYADPKILIALIARD